MIEGDFKRCDGSNGYAPQSLINAQKIIDTKFAKCLMCGTENPNWKLQELMSLSGNKILFQCDKCGGIFSTSNADLTDASADSHDGKFNAIWKKACSLDVNQKYICVEEIGNDQSINQIANVGGYISLERFQVLTALRPSIDKKVAPAPKPVPAPAPKPVPAPAPKPVPAPAPASNGSTTRFADIEAIKQYKELLDQGIITQEEFEKKKKLIMGI